MYRKSYESASRLDDARVFDALAALIPRALRTRGPAVRLTLKPEAQPSTLWALRRWCPELDRCDDLRFIRANGPLLGQRIHEFAKAWRSATHARGMLVSCCMICGGRG